MTPLVDPQCDEVLRRAATWPDDGTVAGARAGEVRRRRELGGLGPAAHAVDALTIPVRDGVIGAVAYRPTADPAPGILVWLHGGGWVIGGPGTCDDQARFLAARSGCVVVVVDYRLAPEHAFPGPVHDAFDATVWIADHAAELGARPGGGMAVGGDSAGGNLAIAVALQARDAGGPALALQALVYPAIDPDFMGPSRDEFAEGHWLTADMMRSFWNHYLGGADPADPLAAPLRADSLAGLPPLYLALADCDLLRDEGLAYAARVEAEGGVPVEVHRHAGMIHGFIACGGIVDRAWVALDDLARATAAALR